MQARLVHVNLASPTARRFSLAALVLFLLAWDLWAIVIDQRVKLADTFVMHTLQLHTALQHDAFWTWLSNLGPKGPLPPLLAYPLLLLLGQAPLAMRLVTVLAHGGLILQTCDLGRMVTGSRRAGLWAALLLGACPFIFGISRIAYHDFLIANAVVGAMQIMLRCRLDRWRPAAALGLVLGAGLLLKHSFVLYMAGPGVWFLLRRVHRPGHLLHLGVMAGVMAALAAIWAVPNGRAVWENLTANTSLGDVPLSQELSFYLGLPGALPLAALAMASALLLGVRRKIGAWELALMFCFVPMMAGFHQVTSAARYLIPVVPLWAVLAGAGLARLQARLPRRAAATAGALAVAAMLIMVVTLNLRGLDPPEGVPREDYGGIISPEAPPHDAFARAVKALAPHGPETLVLYDSVMSYCEKIGQETLWSWRGSHVRPIPMDRARKQLASGEGLSVLYIRQFPNRPLQAPPPHELWPPVREGEHGSLAELPRWVSWFANRNDRKLVATAKDPDGVVFEAYRLDGKPPSAR